MLWSAQCHDCSWHIDDAEEVLVMNQGTVHSLLNHHLIDVWPQQTEES